MMIRRILVVVSLILGLSIFACGSNEPSNDGSLDASQPAGGKGSRAKSIDDEDDVMCRVGKRFPGFAGAVQEGQQLILNFAEEPPKDLTKVVAALRKAGYDVSGDPAVRQVTYGFCQLQSWYEPFASEVLSLDGVVMSDIDESRNEIYIGVDDLERWESEVREIARRFGVPQEALRVGEEDPITLD